MKRLWVRRLDIDLMRLSWSAPRDHGVAIMQSQRDNRKVTAHGSRHYIWVLCAPDNVAILEKSLLICEIQNKRRFLHYANTTMISTTGQNKNSGKREKDRKIPMCLQEIEANVQMIHRTMLKPSKTSKPWLKHGWCGIHWLLLEL